MLVSEVQPENAEFPILVTLSGIVISISDSKPAKALSGINDIYSGIFITV